MSNQFSAGPQALGYLHQTIRYSLYVMVDNLGLGRQERYIRIEKLDDIEIVDCDTPYNSIQVKQTITNLTNRSADFWKTIRVWSENLYHGRIKLPDTILTLATTAKAPENSIASFLRQDNRQPDTALQMMQKETKHVTDSLSDEFAAFTLLSPEQQKSLVNSIQIFDCAPDIDEVVNNTKARFYWVHQEDRDEVYDRLQTWWFSQVVDHLRNKSETQLKITAIEQKIAEINDAIKPRVLRDPFLDEKVPLDYDWDKRTFVLQLRLIALVPQLRYMAIRDFYHASKLRNWLIEELHIKELATYDQRLKDEWALRFYNKKRPQEPSLSNEEAQRQMGQEIYDQVSREVNISIHRDLNDARITRGSYHVLADMSENLELGWHPNFKEELQQLLTDDV